MTNPDPATLLDELLQSTKRLYQAVAEDRPADTNRALHQRDGLIEQLAGVLPSASAAQITTAITVVTVPKNVNLAISGGEF